MSSLFDRLCSQQAQSGLIELTDLAEGIPKLIRKIDFGFKKLLKFNNITINKFSLTKKVDLVTYPMTFIKNIKKFKRLFQENNPPRMVTLDHKKIFRCEEVLGLLLREVLKFHRVLSTDQDGLKFDQVLRLE